MSLFKTVFETKKTLTVNLKKCVQFGTPLTLWSGGSPLFCQIFPHQFEDVFFKCDTVVEYAAFHLFVKVKRHIKRDAAAFGHNSYRLWLRFCNNCVDNRGRRRWYDDFFGMKLLHHSVGCFQIGLVFGQGYFGRKP